MLIGCVVLSAAWLVPLGTNAIHVDWLLVIILLGGTASLIRAGYTLLDRLVIAAAGLAGLLIVAGLLFTFWPWNLSPVPVAGFCNTVLGSAGLVIYHRHGRLPKLPSRVRGTDLILLAAPVTAWFLIRRPISGKSFIEALPYTAVHHDTPNHYSLFDAIHRVGGYQLFRQKQSAPYIAYVQNYPPGTHYLYVLLDVFRRSTTDSGASLPEFLRYAQYEALGFCLLTFAIPWAARWIAGPSVTGWRRVLICSTAAALAVFGQLITLFWQSFDAEVLGLAVLAVAVAVVARPPASVHEQVLLTGLLVMAQAFIYGMFLVDVGFAIVAGFVLHRRLLLRTPQTRDLVIRVAAATIAVAMIPVVFNIYTLSGLLTEPGSFVDFSRSLSIVLGLIAMAACLTRVGRRSPVWRTSSFVVVASCAAALGSELYGKIKTGTPMYYSSKFVEAALVISLCGIGSLGLFLRTDPPTAQDRTASLWSRTARRILSAEAALSLVAIVIPVALANGFPLSAHSEQLPGQPQGTSMTVTWSRGRVIPSWTPDFAAYARAGGTFGDGVPTIFAIASPRRNYIMTMVAAALNHDLGTADLYAIDTTDLILSRQPIDAANPAAAFEALSRLPSADAAETLPSAAALAKVEAWIRIQPPGLRIAVASSAFAGLLRRFAMDEPSLRLSVLYVPGLPTP